MSVMKRVRLELARDPEYPAGSHHHGYEFAAPLDDEGRIDAAEWKKQRERCRVRRFWGDESDEVGHIIHRPGGGWAFHYDIHGRGEGDESGFRFDKHAFKPGEYVSIREHDGVLRTFRVMAVSDLD